MVALHPLLPLVAAAGLFGAVAAGAGAPAAVNRPSAIYPAGDAAHGKVLAETCLACHAENAAAMGDPAVHPPKLGQQHAPSIFYALQDYKDGSRKNAIMGPMAAALSDQDMRDVAVYLSGPPARRGPPGSGGGGPGGGARGAASAVPLAPPDSPGRVEMRESCGFCHGRTGEGVMDGVPVIGGQYADYLRQALADYRSGVRSNATMAAVVKHLTPKQEDAVLAYIVAQPRLENAK